MSVKEKLLRRLLLDAEFYLNNIDGDDPSDPIGDARKAGSGNHPIDAFVEGTINHGNFIFDKEITFGYEITFSF